MNLADISLFQATPAQVRISRERSYDEWGRGITLDEFMTRDTAFEDLPHAENGKFVVWVLSTRDNHSTNLDFFAACETFQREVVVSAIRNSTTKEPFIGYGIASVYTPSHHRRKGYARHMMRLLHYIIAKPGSLPPFPSEWGLPPTIPEGFGRGIVSTLYSDIGPKFYQACGKGLTEGTGWVARKPVGTIWPVPVSGDKDKDNAAKFEEITEETQHRAWEEDAKLIREEISTASTPCFSFLPDQGVANYTQARSKFFEPEKSAGKVWGAKLLDSPSLVYATWVLDPGREGPQTLLINRIRSTPQSFPTLMRVVFKAARDFNLEQVEIWNLDPSLQEVGETYLGGRTSERDDHLSSVAWYGEGTVDEVEWRYNEKFCWC